jgi:hypothetical protein
LIAAWNAVQVVDWYFVSKTVQVSKDIVEKDDRESGLAANREKRSLTECSAAQGASAGGVP